MIDNNDSTELLSTEDARNVERRAVEEALRGADESLRKTIL